MKLVTPCGSVVMTSAGYRSGSERMVAAYLRAARVATPAAAAVRAAVVRIAFFRGDTLSDLGRPVSRSRESSTGGPQVNLVAGPIQESGGSMTVPGSVDGLFEEIT